MKMKSLLAALFILLAIQSLGAKGIDTTAVVTIGGIQQFISIKGQDAANSVLFYLHGGPGASVSSHREQVTGELEEHFVVVHWDQRGSGKTRELNGDSPTPSMSRMKQDAEEVFAYILDRFEREEVVVLGNSWGTVLGFHLVQVYPKMVKSFIAISPIINHRESQQLAFATLQAHFSARENESALAQLQSVAIPITNAEQMLILHRWETVFSGGSFPDEQFEHYLNYFKQWEQQWMPVYAELYSLDLANQIAKIDCPLFVLQGDQDLTTNYQVVESFFDQVAAPEKELIWLEGIGHNIPGTASEAMQDIILRSLIN